MSYSSSLLIFCKYVPILNWMAVSRFKAVWTTKGNFNKGNSEQTKQKETDSLLISDSNMIANKPKAIKGYIMAAS